ncbi:IclR family transcriptional regulator [Rhodococcus rhodnii]|uniref:IclR family transcriptional regulator n=1 Tax=Rhodococcus rhodnii LMG 5362 TaxID=1273125 RepID=R7WIL9_9NOCA|nr:IclR family transcriptional regulator C-terminal domain-containing protein [Rhodococcus rhodnii]EOM75055.1 hypothetical protein Rrhod_3668 [Rhodococcus rhodnii LMG 5362]
MTDTPASATARVFRLLDYIADGGATANFSELARETGINRVTATRLLAELESLDIVTKRPGGGHRPGLRLLTLSALTLGGEDLTSVGRRVLESLSSELGLSAYLVILDGGHARYLLRSIPDRPLVSNISVGSRVPAHLTVPGRVLLAALDDAALRNVLGDEPFTAATTASPTTYAALAPLLDAARSEPVTWSQQGYEQGIDACAAAVPGPGGVPVAAISVAGPSTLFHESDLRDRTGRAVHSAAAALAAVVRPGEPPL